MFKRFDLVSVCAVAAALGCSVEGDPDPEYRGRPGARGGNCTPLQCGPPPLAPNILCPDGETIAGPGDCVPLDGGGCGWEFIECPACGPDDCGPPLGAPNILCPDGVTIGGPGDCVDQDGTCGWEFIECP